LDTNIDPFPMNVTGSDKDVAKGKGIVDLLLPGTADTSQTDLNHVFNPRQVRSPPHNTAVSFPHPIALIPIVDKPRMHHRRG
jgi:hypothetical protein